MLICRGWCDVGDSVRMMMVKYVYCINALAEYARVDSLVAMDVRVEGVVFVPFILRIRVYLICSQAALNFGFEFLVSYTPTIYVDDKFKENWCYHCGMWKVLILSTYFLAVICDWQTDIRAKLHFLSENGLNADILEYLEVVQKDHGTLEIDDKAPSLYSYVSAKI